MYVPSIMLPSTTPVLIITIDLLSVVLKKNEWNCSYSM